MQRCLNCLIDNADHRRFCRRCGAVLLVPCPRCGFANGSDDLFCGGCGGRIGIKTASAVEPSREGNAEAHPPPKGEIFSKRDIDNLVEIQNRRDSAEPEKSTLEQDDIDKIFGGST